jgi:hypothetical protein
MDGEIVWLDELVHWKKAPQGTYRILLMVTSFGHTKHVAVHMATSVPSQRDFDVPHVSKVLEPCRTGLEFFSRQFRFGDVLLLHRMRLFARYS